MNKYLALGIGLAAILVAISFLFLFRESPIKVTFERPVEEERKADSDIKKILAIHSYHKEWGWNQDTEKGIIEGLASKGLVKDKDYEIQSFYMDTKNTYILQGEIQMRADQAKDLINQYKPDLVFINDDNALTYVAVPWIITHKSDGLPFVFSGINSDPTRLRSIIDSADHPGHKITGALEIFPVSQGLALMKRLLPNAKTAILVADSSESSDSIVKQIKKDAVNYPDIGVKITEILQAETFADWQKIIKDHQGNTDILGILSYHQLTDADNKVVPAADVVQWTIDNNKIPEIGFLLFHAEDGFFAATGISPYKTGIYVGEIIARVLNGENPGEIAITDPKKIDIAFNSARAKLLNKKISIDILGLATKIYETIGGIRY